MRLFDKQNGIGKRIGMAPEAERLILYGCTAGGGRSPTGQQRRSAAEWERILQRPAPR